MTDKILPCPFCGTAPFLWKDGGGDERNGYNFMMQLSCRKCGAAIARSSHKDRSGWCDDRGEAKRDVIAAWNSRALAAKDKP